MKNNMSSDEMALLMQTFYDKNNNTFKSCGYIDFTDGRKTPLISNYVIYLSSNMSSNGFYAFAYNLQPYTREFLNSNLRKNNIEIIGNSFKYRLT